MIEEQPDDPIKPGADIGSDVDTTEDIASSGEDAPFPDQIGLLVASLNALTDAVRALVARSPVSSEELLTAEQLGELFRMSPRALRDLAAVRLIPHHRIGKHYRFSRDDIADILQATKNTLVNRRPGRRAA